MTDKLQCSNTVALLAAAEEYILDENFGGRTLLPALVATVAVEPNFQPPGAARPVSASASAFPPAAVITSTTIVPPPTGSAAAPLVLPVARVTGG